MEAHAGFTKKGQGPGFEQLKRTSEPSPADLRIPNPNPQIERRFERGKTFPEKAACCFRDAILCLTCLWSEWQHAGRLSANSGTSYYITIKSDEFLGNSSPLTPNRVKHCVLAACQHISANLLLACAWSRLARFCRITTRFGARLCVYLQLGCKVRSPSPISPVLDCDVEDIDLV